MANFDFQPQLFRVTFKNVDILIQFKFSMTVRTHRKLVQTPAGMKYSSWLCRNKQFGTTGPSTDPSGIWARTRDATTEYQLLVCLLSKQ